MDNTVDLLRIKIENAKKQLSKETLAAIAAVPWQAEILKMRETKRYTFEQLEDLEIETELVLCGLVSPKDYPKELGNRMRLSKAQVNDLLNEMNKQVFSKIQEELRKITERIPSLLVKEGVGSGNSKEHHPAFGTPPQQGGENTNTPDTEDEKKINTQILNSAGIEIIPEKLELIPPPLDKGRIEEMFLNNSPHPDPLLVKERGNTPTILTQKLSGSVKNEIVKTDHSLANLTPSNAQNAAPAKPSIDPYREIPE